MAGSKPSILQDERKKRVLAIAGVATLALLFVTFLVSLNSDSEQAAESQDRAENEIVIENNNAQGSIKVPASVRYSYDAKPDNLDDSTDNNAPVQYEKDAVTDTLETVENNQNANETLAPGIEENEQSTNLKAYLYCDSFTDFAEAQKAKATIAFSGVISTVAEFEGRTTLKIGPFDSRDLAKIKFKDLNSKGLVKTCTLIDE